MRKVLEYIVRDVFERRFDQNPGSRPLDNLVTQLVKENHFPALIGAYATGVRELGNVGTHKFGEKITAQDVQRSLNQLKPILEWYFENERPEAMCQNNKQNWRSLPLNLLFRFVLLPTLQSFRRDYARLTPMIQNSSLNSSQVRVTKMAFLKAFASGNIALKKKTWQFLKLGSFMARAVAENHRWLKPGYYQD